MRPFLNSRRLTSLRRLGIASAAKHPEPFLETHGKKLLELDIAYTAVEGLQVEIFELCPHLSFISLFSNISVGHRYLASDASADCNQHNPPDADHFHPLQPVASLPKIRFILPGDINKYVIQNLSGIS